LSRFADNVKLALQSDISLERGLPRRTFRPKIVDGSAYPKLKLYFYHSLAGFRTFFVIIESCLNPLARMIWEKIGEIECAWSMQSRPSPFG